MCGLRIWQIIRYAQSYKYAIYRETLPGSISEDYEQKVAYERGPWNVLFSRQGVEMEKNITFSQIFLIMVDVD